MRDAFRSSAIAAVALLAFAVLGSAPAQAETPFARLQDRADAWKQVEPLLRKRAHPKASGFDFEPTFKVKTASGYTVRVAALGSSVAVIVGRGEGKLSAYLTRGIATSRRLQASYGPFGELDMRFHPSARVPKLPPRRGCHGLVKYPERHGTWVGSLRFEGEDHSFAIDVHRAGGGIRRQTPICFFHHHRRHSTATASAGPFSSFFPREAVAAGWHRGLESATVVGLDGLAGTVYFAFSQRVSGPVAIIHIAATVAKPGTLSVNSALTHAEISPPAPFHGTGTYTAAPDGSTAWTGDLTVNFPGLPAFPLTGEEFKAEVRRPL